jgi:serine/threonine protein kinase
VDLGLAQSAKMSISTGRVVGTHGYIAPELFIDGAHADFRGDIYSLGITLHEALSGKRGPPSSRSDLAGHTRAAHRLAMVLLRMTSPDPADRPSTYDDVIDSLRRAAR